jgi:Iron-containing redox enzyme
LSNSAVLHRKIGLVLPELVGAGRRLIESPQLPELYPDFLITSHGIIRASVPLMQRARDEAAQRAGDDPVCAALAPYLDEHIEEERHHDDWLLDDLETLGRRRDDVLARPPTATIAGLVGAQYYWVLHYHPVAVLGYIALLEGYPPSPAMLEELSAGSGYPPEAFRTLRLHAELDPGHGAELDRMLDGLALTPPQTTVIGLSAIASAHGFARAIADIVD